MHLMFGYLFIPHTNLLINGKKKRFHVQNCPCGTVGATIGYVLGLLVHDKVVFSKLAEMYFPLIDYYDKH